MLIYRCETLNNNGIYFNNPEDWDPVISCHRRGDYDQYPCWSEDGIDYLPTRGIFGFSSIEQMRQWFIGVERLFLSSCGVHLSCYATQEVRLGRRQAIFYLEESTLIWQKPLSHF